MRYRCTVTGRVPKWCGFAGGEIEKPTQILQVLRFQNDNPRKLLWLLLGSSLQFGSSRVCFYFVRSMVGLKMFLDLRIVWMPVLLIHIDSY